jgi:hypothetical protein
MTITVGQIKVADPPDAWRRAGFCVDSGGDAGAACRIGGVRFRLAGSDRGTGVLGWSLRGLPPGDSVLDLDGIPTTRSDTLAAAPAEHANGVIAIDHVVLLSPDLGRTVDSLTTIGVLPRRERDGELGDRATPVKAAVQPGRRITTLRHHALGMSVRSAMISAPILGS